MTEYNRYPEDILNQKIEPQQRQEIRLEIGVILEHAGTEYCGAVTQISSNHIELEDWHKNKRLFSRQDVFMVEGKPVTLKTVKTITPTQRQKTASGSFALKENRAKIAQANRILVEGKHDAELIEKIWGDDLRAEAIVVEYLSGADKLLQYLDQIKPNKNQKIGVLLDHLITGSKESKIAQEIYASAHGKYVKILGHPYIDIWQAVKPQKLNMQKWPEIPYGQDWKSSICEHLGLASKNQSDIANAWQHILAKVTKYQDLEPELVGKVEALIDFVTEI